MIDSLFTIPVLKIKVSNFKKKKKEIEKILKEYPEKRDQGMFSSNRNHTDQALTLKFTEIFREELEKMTLEFQRNIGVNQVWSVSYTKGDFHIPHSHGSKGYAGILYLDHYPESPQTIYLQPWNNEEDATQFKYFKAEEGTMVIVPRFVIHFTKPNLSEKKKRIVGFDFLLAKPVAKS
jgi:hypothetical protein